MNTLPRVYITSPNEWNPLELDAEVPDLWYTQNNSDPVSLRTTLFKEDGTLRDDMEEDDEDHSNQLHKSIDRRDMRVHRTEVIKDELYDSDKALPPLATRQYSSSDSSDSDSDDDVHDDMHQFGTMQAFPVTIRSKFRQVIPRKKHKKIQEEG